MHYDIEADWTLFHTCNYRCNYCFWSPELLGSKMKGVASADQWVDAFDRSGLTWLLHMTGGEPSLHPEFARLCARLAERHYISINTNLSRPSIAEMAKAVDPARVSLVQAALHPDQRSQRKEGQVFARNLAALREHGHPVLISVVATPEVLEQFEVLARICRPLGLRPVPKLLRGFHRGRRYPESYTDGQRERFKAISRWARESYGELAASRSEEPTVWPIDDDQWLDRSREFRGTQCHAGKRFVAIDPDGAVFRCSTEEPLGNLLAGDFARRDSAAPCTTSYCYYFCRKHSHTAGLVSSAQSLPA